jgi:cation diffusion facilitator family transporter
MKEKIAILSMLANAFLAGGKIFIGYVSNSSAILAEGFHSLTDVFSSSIGYFGIKASQKPVDKEHPYGHYKLEVLSGVIITMILFATGGGIIYDAYKNFLDPNKLKISYLSFFIMLASVIINFLTSKIKIYYGKKENSFTLLADGSHDKADVLASLTVLIGLFLSKYWIYMDVLLAFLIGLYIIKESVALGKEAVDSLLDVSAGGEVEEKIKNVAKNNQIEILSLKTQKRGSSITANIEIGLAKDLKIEEATKISERLKNELMKEIDNLTYVSIQIESHEIESISYQPSLGASFGWKRRGRFAKKIEKATGKGPDGKCVCPKCNYSISHEKGVPCSILKCPKCNVSLERK